MSKVTIGILFIVAGIAYGSMVIDSVYQRTLGYLVENKWITPPPEAKTDPSLLGKKGTIVLYSLSLIAIGIFLLWNHNS